MTPIKIKTTCTKVPAGVSDVVTPVSIYLKLRDVFPNTLLLESSDYHGNRNSMSFVCFEPEAEFKVHNGTVTQNMPGQEPERFVPDKPQDVPALLDAFLKSFEVQSEKLPVNVSGLFGYSAYAFKFGLCKTMVLNRVFIERKMK